MIGSFLWSEVYILNSTKFLRYKSREIKILKKFRPTMLSVNKFTMDYVKKFTNNLELGWPIDVKVDFYLKKNIRNILVIGGGTNILNNQLQSIIMRILSKSNYVVYSSNVLLELFSEQRNLNKFNFTTNEFKKIDLIIARPGLGTITDAVTYNIPILTVYESNNEEMKFNAHAVCSNNFGLDINYNFNEIEKIIDEMVLNKNYTYYQKSLSKENKKGLDEISNFIINKLKHE